MRSMLRLVAPLVAVGLVLSACSGSDDEPSDNEPVAKKEPATWPLTGLEAKGKKVATKYPVYIVKVPNTIDAAPRYALGKADMVTEELVEGGITRLAVSYHSQLPQKVGPVRSMRATDAGIASPVDAQIVTSGAAPYTFNALKKAGVKWIDMNNPNVTRLSDGSHSSLYSVVANLKAIASEAKQKATRPDDYFPWADGNKLTGKKKPAKSVSATFSPARTTSWTFEGGKYTTTDEYEPEADQFRADTVVAAQVRTSIAPYKDPGGAAVPVSHFEGKGQAWVFNGGKMVRATWSKKSEDAPVKFALKNGKKLELPPGNVYLSLIPKDGGSVSFR